MNNITKLILNALSGVKVLTCLRSCFIYGIQRCVIGVGSITEVKQRRARFIIGWVTAWDCQVPYTLYDMCAAMSCRGAQRTT